MANKNINLSAPIRSNLLTLQNTSDLIGRAEKRLASGLKVQSPIDNAVAYFQAKALSDRGSDMAEKKDGIDQGISQLQTALTAIDSIQTLVKQMKGLLISAKSSTEAERADLQKQFNVLAKNITTLADDANYQGVNLVNSTTSKLKVDFSNASDSYLEIQGRDLRATQLFALVGGFPASAMAAASAMATVLIAMPWAGISNNVDMLDAGIVEIEKTLSVLRGAAKAIGSNVALLQTRLDFTKTYENTLKEGAGKLTFADLNEEGANLVALQTRQQLGVQALQFSGQAEQAVLQLFR